MNKIIEDKLNKLYLDVMDKPNRILEIFNNFFGEDRVDMQGFMNIKELITFIGNNSLHLLINSDCPIFDSYYSYNDHAYDLFKNVPEDKQTIILDNLRIEYLLRDIRGFILVYFPKVRITNEYDRYVDIKDLYAKVSISSDGTINGRFALNRATYTRLHYLNNYMHSHVSSIPTRDFTQFQTPCTGSGPINSTISSLCREYDSDLWELFCLELSKYVEVESIAGAPYHRLENLIESNTRCTIDITPALINYTPPNFYKRLMRDFVKYIIKQDKLKFNFINGSYSIAMSPIEYIITISNEFIDWYNKKYNEGVYTRTLQDLLDNGTLKKCIISNNKIYITRNNVGGTSIRDSIGKYICTFKGKRITLNITTDIEGTNQNESIILDIYSSFYILSKILFIINYKYGKSEQTDSEGNRISKKVKYF